MRLMSCALYCLLSVYMHANGRWRMQAASVVLVFGVSRSCRRQMALSDKMQSPPQSACCYPCPALCMIQLTTPSELATFAPHSLTPPLLGSDNHRQQPIQHQDSHEQPPKYKSPHLLPNANKPTSCRRLPTAVPRTRRPDIQHGCNAGRRRRSAGTAPTRTVVL